MRLNEIRLIKKEHLDFLRKIIRVEGALSMGHSSSKTTEIHTHVNSESIKKIKSPLANLNLSEDDQNNKERTK
ncbi:hypothetical protein CHISP_3721 [Chitinispirillum alkaliphilum]|nr:hypothetical protein CHISP_3721 [Chitinispirillum alkaliphilum]